MNDCRRYLFAAALAVLLVACTGVGAIPSTAPSQSASQTAATTAGLSVREVEATYGTLAVHTTPGAECAASLVIEGGVFGELPRSSLPEIAAGPEGIARWTYSAPRVPAGTGSFTATCTLAGDTAQRTGAFTIPTRPLQPTGFKVRVTTDDPRQARFDPDPSLVPLRDASLAAMRTTLATEWGKATRGLGSLEVVEGSADIAIYVVAARATSVHRRNEVDNSYDIVLYVADPTIGTRNVENNVAVALHELGHIWCCYGAGTLAGHWSTKEAQPGLYGVDRYGLMTDPVTCLIFRGVVSCPNRFSDREMLALGFTAFPPPAPDPCIVEALGLQAQIAAVRPTLSDLLSQIRSLEAQYPNGMPKATYDTYVALIQRYNSLVAGVNAKTQQLNALPCDPSA